MIDWDDTAAILDRCGCILRIGGRVEEFDPTPDPFADIDTGDGPFNWIRDVGVFTAFMVLVVLAVLCWLALKM